MITTGGFLIFHFRIMLGYENLTHEYKNTRNIYIYIS